MVFNIYNPDGSKAFSIESTDTNCIESNDELSLESLMYEIEESNRSAESSYVECAKYMDTVEVLSTEGFGENVKTALKTVIEKIINFFKKMIQAIKNFFQKVKINKTVGECKKIESKIDEVAKLDAPAAPLLLEEKHEEIEISKFIHKILTGDDSVYNNIKQLNLKMSTVLAKTEELCSDVKKYVSEASKLKPDDAHNNPDQFRTLHMFADLDDGYDNENVQEYFAEAKSDLVIRLIDEVKNEVFYAFDNMCNGKTVTVDSIFLKENIQKCKKYLMSVGDIVVGANKQLNAINGLLNESVNVLQAFRRDTVYNTDTAKGERIGNFVKKLANVLSVEYTMVSKYIMNNIKAIDEINRNIDHLLGLK